MLPEHIIFKHVTTYVHVPVLGCDSVWSCKQLPKKNNPEEWLLLTAGTVPRKPCYPIGIGVANLGVFQECNRIGWREIAVQVRRTLFILVQY
jgi:hypothetical protein